MDEAWPNAPSLTIIVNFKKSYCVGTFNRAKFEQNKIKITKLGKIRATKMMCQSTLLECWLALMKYQLALLNLIQLLCLGLFSSFFLRTYGSIQTENWWWILIKWRIHAHILQKNSFHKNMLVISHYENILGQCP